MNETTVKVGKMLKY